MPTLHVTGTQPHDIKVLTNSAPLESIDVSGITSMNIQMAYGDETIVNLAAHSMWIGGVSLSADDTLIVDGPGSWYNTSSSINGNAIIAVPVIGSGVINQFIGHDVGKLEFMSSVSSGQTVNDSGYEFYGGEHGRVQVDNPAAYHATTVLGFGDLILEGLHASAYTYHNDMLTLFNGAKVVDSLKIDIQTLEYQKPGPLGVANGMGGVVIYTDGAGANLPKVAFHH